MMQGPTPFDGPSVTSAESSPSPGRSPKGYFHKQPSLSSSGSASPVEKAPDADFLQPALLHSFAGATTFAPNHRSPFTEDPLPDSPPSTRRRFSEDTSGHARALGASDWLAAPRIRLLDDVRSRRPPPAAIFSAPVEAGARLPEEVRTRGVPPAATADSEASEQWRLPDDVRSRAAAAAAAAAPATPSELTPQHAEVQRTRDACSGPLAPAAGEEQPRFLDGGYTGGGPHTAPAHTSSGGAQLRLPGDDIRCHSSVVAAGAEATLNSVATAPPHQNADGVHGHYPSARPAAEGEPLAADRRLELGDIRSRGIAPLLPPEATPGIQAPCSSDSHGSAHKQAAPSIKQSAALLSLCDKSPSTQLRQSCLSKQTPVFHLYEQPCAHASAQHGANHFCSMRSTCFMFHV
jgi:hypothetical protein